MRPYVRKLAICAVLLHSLGYVAAAPRALGATIFVTTHADELNADNDCALREAIQAANTDTPVDACPAGAGADTIVLDDGVYLLSRAGAGEDNNQTGDLDLAGTLTIRGVDANTSVIDASGLGDRVFHVLPGANVTLQGLRVTRGGDSANPQLDGGAILVDSANANLRNLDLANNAAGRNGGAVYSAGGHVLVADSAVRDNATGAVSSGRGGGLYNATGSLALDNSIVSNNTSGEGGGIFNLGHIDVSDSWIHDNAADTNGAGIYSSATAIITGTVLDSNHASAQGGNLYSGTPDEASSLVLVSSELRSGLAGQGGAIFNQGALEVSSSSFALNTAASGSVLYSSAQSQLGQIRNATIVSNTLSTGGSAALENAGTATITLYNTLLGGNGANPNCAGPIVSGGHNLDFGGSCGFQASGDIAADPKLGPLPVVDRRPNSFPVDVGSPAVNAGDNATCAVLDIFQQPRPHGVKCDIGAFELNTAPAAGSAEAYATAEDTPLSVVAPGVLSNDADPDNDPLSAVLASGPAHGTLSLGGDGSFVYTPAANYYGPDQFTYRASDGALATAPVVVQLSVTPVNDPPIVNNDAFSITTPAPLSIAAAALLLNDSDAEHDLLAITAAGPVSAHGGRAILNGTTIDYTPPRNYTGPDSFGYTVSDGHGGISSGLVNITISTRYVFLPLALH